MAEDWGIAEQEAHWAERKAYWEEKKSDPDWDAGLGPLGEDPWLPGEKETVAEFLARGGDLEYPGRRTSFPPEGRPEPGVTYFPSRPGGYTEEEIEEKWPLGEYAPTPAEPDLPLAPADTALPLAPALALPDMPAITPGGNGVSLTILGLIFLG